MSEKQVEVSPQEQQLRKPPHIVDVTPGHEDSPVFQMYRQIVENAGVPSEKVGEVVRLMMEYDVKVILASSQGIIMPYSDEYGPDFLEGGHHKENEVRADLERIKAQIPSELHELINLREARERYNRWFNWGSSPGK